MKEYKRISYEERVKIELMLEQGKRPSEISITLHRHKSTIIREIKRNSGSTYRSMIANVNSEAAQRNKHRGNKIQSYPFLEYYIQMRIRQGWSPEQISKRLKQVKTKNKRMQISHESIYTYIYLKCKGELRKELIKQLRQEKYDESDQ